jgi:hypothetical protein
VASKGAQILTDSKNLARRHVAFGWWALAAFASLGLTLEILHGFKVAAYLDASHETRRLMWRLAHAHGALLGVVNLAYGLGLAGGAVSASAHAGGSELTSKALLGASVLLPGGFFLGGVSFYAGDPGLGVALVPVGAILLLLALIRIALSTAGGVIR